MRLQLASSLVPWLLLAGLSCGLGAAQAARADAASGTYTGSVGLRGNYYWERSTRVLAPALTATLETPKAVRLDGTYLIDAITSASVATGVQTDRPFTEVRHDVQAGVGYGLDVGAHALDIRARGRYSQEPDYVSRGGGLSVGLLMNQKNTGLRLNGYFLHDTVYARRLYAPPDDPDRLVADEPLYLGTLDALSLGLAWDQVLTPTWIVTVGGDTSLLRGFTSNPYRTAVFADGGGRDEEHPDLRVRGAAYVWLAHYLTATRSAVRAGYRLYRDTWSILAHAADARVHQELGAYAELRLRYRHYRQNSAFFSREGGNLRSDRYVTADPKMTAFHNHTFGLKLRLSLDFLSRTGLDLLHRAVLDWSFEYILNTNRFGNGVIAQGGFLWPF